jgi:hypothetical protein
VPAAHGNDFRSAPCSAPPIAELVAGLNWAGELVCGKMAMAITVPKHACAVSGWRVPGRDDRVHADRDDAACDGKVTLNELPLPTSLETSIRPRCASTIRRAM